MIQQLLSGVYLYGVDRKPMRNAMLWNAAYFVNPSQCKKIRVNEETYKRRKLGHPIIRFSQREVGKVVGGSNVHMSTQLHLQECQSPLGVCRAKRANAIN